MGADMLLYCCEAPTSYAKAWPVIEYRLESLTNDQLEAIAEDCLWYDAQEIWEEHEELNLKEDDLYKLDDLYGISLRKMVREKLMEAVKELIGSPEGNFSTWRRDLAHMTLGETSYMFSGGMSWGDQPSEACDYYNLIENSGLFEVMGYKDFDYESFKA